MKVLFSVSIEVKSKRKKPNPNPKLRCKGVRAYLIAADRIPRRRVREEDVGAHRMSSHIGVPHRWSLEGPPQGTTVQAHRAARNCGSGSSSGLPWLTTAHRGLPLLVTGEGFSPLRAPPHVRSTAASAHAGEGAHERHHGHTRQCPRFLLSLTFGRAKWK
jgi:hypothetical protein